VEFKATGLKLEIQPVDSLDLPELAPYRTMKWQNEHRQEGIFVAEGEKVVRRLLESDMEVISLLLPPAWLDEYADLLAKRPEPVIRAFTAERNALEELTGFTMYQGVLAVGRVPQPMTLDKMLAQAAQPTLLVAVESVSNAQNLGGLVRNCAAFGAHGIITGETCCSPYLRRAVRGSMGTIFKLPALEVPNLVATMSTLRGRGYRAIAAHPHTDQRRLSQADFRNNVVILLGSEGSGLSAAILEQCDEAVAIPMQNGVDSLNVGTAGAVFLYEAARQRGLV
jgi:tRNA G18 (ribose-2'-O)-methylase SpoU